MLTGRTIICPSTIEWGFSWQPNQEIMYRLAAAGNRVLFIESTGARNVRLADWRRVLGRLRSGLGARQALQRSHPNVDIYSPLVLPFPHAPLAHALNTRIVFRTVDAWLRRPGHGDPLLWAFLASPMTLALIDHVRPVCVVYHCMGDVSASRPVPGIALAERQLLRRCDIAFANSLQLLEHVRQIAPRAYLFRAGVDVDAFQRAAADAQTPPAEFAGWAGPVAGYIGSIHQWVDVELLAAVAQRLPAWQFVMIGPVLRDVGPLRALSNVHWLGQRPHHELPKYIQYFDVGIIPYVLDSYTASAFPGKLNEYLALGKAVVATPLPELVAYNAEYGNVVTLAAGDAEFAAAISGSCEAAPDRTARLHEVAEQHSWKEALDRMSKLIGEVSGISRGR